MSRMPTCGATPGRDRAGCGRHWRTTSSRCARVVTSSGQSPALGSPGPSTPSRLARDRRSVDREIRSGRETRSGSEQTSSFEACRLRSFRSPRSSRHRSRAGPRRNVCFQLTEDVSRLTGSGNKNALRNDFQMAEIK